MRAMLANDCVLDDGCVGVLSKPINKAALLKTLAKHFEENTET